MLFIQYDWSKRIVKYTLIFFKGKKGEQKKDIIVPTQHIT